VLTTSIVCPIVELSEVNPGKIATVSIDKIASDITTSISVNPYSYYLYSTCYGIVVQTILYNYVTLVL